MRKALVAAVLGSLVLLVSPTPASAHAELDSSSPRNGAVLAAAPTTVSLVFGEPVEVQQIELLDAKAAPIASRSTTAGTTVTITPESRLGKGATIVQWKALSDDGHLVTGAIAFIVGKPGPAGKPASIVTSPRIVTVLKGNRSGPLTVTFVNGATSGEVEWTNPAYAGPFTWRVTGNGRLAQATGVLPTPGRWTMRATLVGKSGSVMVADGGVTLG